MNIESQMRWNWAFMRSGDSKTETPEYLIAGHEHAGIRARRQVALVNAKVARADQTRVRQCKLGIILLLLAIIIVCIGAEDKGRGILGSVLECGGNGERQVRRVRRGIVRAGDHAERRESEEEERAETTAHLVSLAACSCVWEWRRQLLEHKQVMATTERQRTVSGSGIFSTTEASENQKFDISSLEKSHGNPIYCAIARTFTGLEKNLVETEAHRPNSNAFLHPAKQICLEPPCCTSFLQQQPWHAVNWRPHRYDAVWRLTHIEKLFFLSRGTVCQSEIVYRHAFCLQIIQCLTGVVLPPVSPRSSLTTAFYCHSCVSTEQQSLAESTAHIAWLMRSVVGAKPTLDKSMV
jgi:hypothetical protein